MPFASLAFGVARHQRWRAAFWITRDARFLPALDVNSFVPVLAGAAAYGLAEAMGWKEGLELKATGARGFYGVIAFSVLAALVIQYSPIDPMKALVWSAVINGVVAVSLMAVIVLLALKKSVMGKHTANRSLIALGWIGTAVMGVAALGMLLP